MTSSQPPSATVHKDRKKQQKSNAHFPLIPGAPIAKNERGNTLEGLAVGYGGSGGHHKWIGIIFQSHGHITLPMGVQRSMLLKLTESQNDWGCQESLSPSGPALLLQGPQAQAWLLETSKEETSLPVGRLCQCSITCKVLEISNNIACWKVYVLCSLGLGYYVPVISVSFCRSKYNTTQAELSAACQNPKSKITGHPTDS